MYFSRPNRRKRLLCSYRARASEAISRDVEIAIRQTEYAMEQVYGIGMPHHTRRGIVGQHALQPPRRGRRAVGDDDHASVPGKADAVVDAHPGGPEGRVRVGVRGGQHLSRNCGR